ncbi:MAG: carboxypeptidase regulatory-like domain-containing protein [Saprospiraceae bacterium]|nr:carboxypeptidase regulatory-like domain-containing protein [Candidatus Opimibacter iunctus]
MKTKSILLVLSVLFYFGCSTDDSIVPTKEIKGSLFVMVKDPAGKPVQGATIDIGDQTVTTDEDGTYFFTQITLTGDDYLQVAKTGYFKGSRRFVTSGSPTQFLNITLLPQQEIGSFSSTQASIISIDAKSSLTFPDHAVTRADGSTYQGNVHVLANPIYGDDPLLSQKMPGTLTGLDQSGTKVALGSLGMIALELQADDGGLLQIASGKTVELRLAIPTKQINTAPSTIPLWYFDDAKGYWVEEGQAVLDGKAYVAHLPHFSFWNCDEMFTLVNWQARFIYSNGMPAQNVTICLTNPRLNDQRCAQTDANGVISGGIPADEVLEISLEGLCGMEGYADQVGPFSDDVKMDDIVVEELNMATISGTALQCDGSPLKSGFVKVSTPKGFYVFPITDAAGHYEGSYVFCEGDVLTLRVYDTANGLLSLSHFISFDRNLDAGSIKACEEADEFIRYKITGFSRAYSYYNILTSSSGYTSIESLDSIGYRGRLGWTFDGVTTGQYRGYTMSGNQINLPNGQVGYVLKMDLDVTEYGPNGGYISGSFSGKINVGGNGSGGSGDSDFAGSFSVRRK